MSAATVADLLADLIGTAPMPKEAPARAKAANSANRERLHGMAPDSTPCEAPRIHANPGATESRASADSQVFAGVRSHTKRPESEERCGLSQSSHDSQRSISAEAIGDALDLAAVAWMDADIARYHSRRERLIRWGWAEPAAEKLAERLVRRDRELDDRVSCTTCQHYRPGRCMNHRVAQLQSPELSRALAEMLQRCPGFIGTPM